MDAVDGLKTQGVLLRLPGLLEDLEGGRVDRPELLHDVEGLADLLRLLLDAVLDQLHRLPGLLGVEGALEAGGEVPLLVAVDGRGRQTELFRNVPVRGSGNERLVDLLALLVGADGAGAPSLTRR